MAITPDEISRIKRYEGNRNHFYLDTGGQVTVGYGHLVANINSSVSLNLIRKTDGLPATTVEKQTEWTTIKSKPSGKQYPATYYDQFCNLTLQQSDIDKFLTVDLNSTENQLSSKFTNYSQYPQTAKAGLVDMGFNLGVQGIFNSFPTFAAAVQRQDWTTAANECNRPGLDPHRNTEVKQLFLQAVHPAPTHPHPTPTHPHPTPTHPTPTHPHPTPTTGTGSTGSTFHIADVPHWLHNFPENQHNQPVSSVQQTTPAISASALPANLTSNCTELQSIVAIVALSSNVTTAAITAITAIASMNKK